MKQLNIIKTLITICMAGFMCLAVNMTSQAAPVTMADGTIFDAEFYAATYPDVVAAFGTDADLLYMHYQLCGKTEGRFPNAAEKNAATAAAVTTPIAGGTVPSTGVTISSLGSRYAAVSADVMLDGAGTGYHAKISLQNGIGSAISFGIQYDLFGQKPYNGKTVFLSENVVNNLPGGQVYTRHGYANLGVPTNIMIVLDTQTGMVYLYVNGTLVGQVANTNLLQGNLSAVIEGSGRIDGDTVFANFSNVRFKKAGTSNTSGDSVYFWKTQNTNAGIATAYSGSAPGGWCTSSNITVRGTIIGLGPFDWDSAYANVSGMGIYALWL